MKNAFCLCAALLLLAACAAWAEPPVDGETLVRNLWNTSATGQWSQKTDDISPAFMAVQSSGTYDKTAELAALKKAKMGNYELTGFRVTRQGPVMVVTYLARVEEIRVGMRLPGKTAPRMSVFIKTDLGWQWLAHASMPVK